MSALHPSDNVPEGVPLPRYDTIASPIDAPPEIRAFLGSAGRWWGTWRSPQTKGSYDAVLVIQEIYRQDDGWEARVTYASASYPKWYVEGGQWESIATFKRKTDGKTVLLVKHPAAGVMEFWFQAKRLQGKLSMRFMLSRIALKPLP